MKLSTILLLLSGSTYCSDQQCDSQSCDEVLKVNFENGQVMPGIGLGTAGFTDQDLITRVIDAALSSGYRMIDTADLYNNHQQISLALENLLPKYGLQRQDIFIITKIRPSDLGYLKCKYTISRFLEELSTNFLDLVLIHAPDIPPILGMAPSRSDQKILRDETWRCLQEFNKDGVIKSIGVSNYNEHQLQEVLNIGEPKPQVNQVYKTPLHDQDEGLLKLASQHNIHLQAFSSLGSHTESRILRNKVLNVIAKKYSVSSAQVVLKWLIVTGWSVLPKSSNPEHIAQNIKLSFNLNKKDILKINNLSSNFD